MVKRLLSIVSLLVVTFGLSVSSANANPPPLPSLPSQTIINSVLTQTGGATFTPLNIPNWVINQLSTFNGVFDGIENAISRTQSVSYINTSGSVREIVIPLTDARTTQLEPVFMSPGSNSRPAKVVGAVVQPARNQGNQVMIVVAIFKENAFSCYNCDPPEKVRFYRNSNQYYEYSIITSNFYDPNGDLMVEPVDDGAVIAHNVSCVTVGLEQACWSPYSYSAVRQEPLPKDLIYDAHTAFKDLYDLSVDFYVDDAVPDIIGVSQRTACSNQLFGAVQLSNLTSCQTNAVIGASKDYIAGQPFAILVFTSSADIRAYTDDGVYLGSLPAGEYLAIDATPSMTTIGAATVTFLVNADGQNHYLIPGRRLQGFGYSPAYDVRQAGIKDGFANWTGWGG